MNLKQALLGAQAEFKARDITSASLDAEVLLWAAVNRDRKIPRAKEWLYLHFSDYQLSSEEEEYFAELVKRHLQHEPVAYLLGHKEFHGLDFLVDKRVLIPRPESELLVDQALGIMRRSPADITLMDIGTGSGCIPISILDELRRTGELGRVQRTFADDLSPAALEVAEANARRHRLRSRITFLAADLGEALCRLQRSERILITANLPYVSERDYETLGPNVKDFEPRLALTTSEEGLYLIRRLIEGFAELCPRPASYCLLLEADPRQMKSIERMARCNLPGCVIETVRDLRGKKRVMKIVSR